jgi:hypothetical protein
MVAGSLYGNLMVRMALALAFMGSASVATVWQVEVSFVSTRILEVAN